MIENAAGIKSAAESLQVKITEIRSKENERLNVLKGKTLAKEAFRKQIVTQGLSAGDTQGFAQESHRAFQLGTHTGLCPVLTNCALSGLALVITQGLSAGKRHRALPCVDKLRPFRACTCDYTGAFSREETQGFHLGTHRALPLDHIGLCPVLTNCALSGLALVITQGLSAGKRHRAFNTDHSGLTHQYWAEQSGVVVLY